MKGSLSLGDHRDFCNAGVGQGFSTSWHGLAHGFVVFVRSCPSHLPPFCSQVCPEADKAKGREGLFWHEALAMFGPKKVLLFQFFTRLWGVLGS